MTDTRIECFFKDFMDGSYRVAYFLKKWLILYYIRGLIRRFIIVFNISYD